MRCIIFCLFLGSLFLLGACSKEETTPKLEATIHITSPSPGQVFEKGDTIHIEADIEAKQELHGWELVIRKKADNSVVYTTDKHTHGTTLHIHDHWVNDVTQHSDMVLEITAALDHSGDNLKTEKVDFHCHPN